MITLKSDTFLQGGKYKIVRFISAGGFGCTYEGVHVLLKKRVAIKEFFVKDFCNRDEATAAVTIGTTSKTALVKKLKTKFVEEAQFVSTLKHQHVVNVYDVFEENGTAYYVMDYVDGPSLNEVVKRDGAMNEKKAQKYILQVADALKYVHSQNRLHLDVKPGNIMIDKDDNAILIDFGTSKQYDEEAGENTSTLMGKTPGFAPLEQMGNDVVKFYPSTDIYSLGATFYKLLTGITPPSATLLASGEELKPLPSSISENVRNAVNKAMQTNKNKRPQSIDEFVKILSAPVEEDDTIYGNDDKVEDEPTEVTIDKADDKKTKLSKTKIGIIVGVCSIALVAVLGLLLNNKQTFVDATGQEFTYTGEVVNGKPNGQGMGIYPYGTYVGSYQNGLRHGEGKFESKDGSNKYEGTFLEDKYDKGKLTLTDGTNYEGTFSNGQPNAGIWYDKNCSVDSLTVNGVTYKMVPVFGGTFTMGATSEMKNPFDWEKPTHQVTLSNYYIGQTEVTQALWKAVMGQTVTEIANANNWKTYGVGDDYPMYDISWNDCQTFISKLNSLTGKNFRLPTEAEWEFAARGGNKSNHTPLSGSNNSDAVAWYNSNSGNEAHPVATKQANELGIYDMSGNVWEWCSDWYGSYSSSSQTNPKGPNSGANRVIRGGGWDYFAADCRLSYRLSCDPDYRYGYLGFRLCLSPDPVIIENDSTKVNNLAQVEEALRQRKEYVTGQTFKDAAGKEFTYSGVVANGKPNGQGMGVYSYGTYVGTYQNGMRHGDGKFESKDGSNKYEGSFANDKYDNGKLILTDGSYYKGTFSKGQPYTGTWYNKDGSVDSNIVEGK